MLSTNMKNVPTKHGGAPFTSKSWKCHQMTLTVLAILKKLQSVNQSNQS